MKTARGHVDSPGERRASARKGSVKRKKGVVEDGPANWGRVFLEVRDRFRMACYAEEKTSNVNVDYTY